MRTFFTADTHFAHENILKITSRGLHFRCIEDHDSALLYAINSHVTEADRLYVLGDFAWRAGKSYTDQIRCKNIHLIMGNHDRANFGKLFRTCEDTALIKMGEQKVFLSHYPHAYWPSSHRGGYHLYGHVHAEREETLDRCFPGRRSMDCGVDRAYQIYGCYRPFDFETIHEIFRFHAGHDPVAWYEERQASRDMPTSAPSSAAEAYSLAARSPCMDAHGKCRWDTDGDGNCPSCASIPRGRLLTK